MTRLLDFGSPNPFAGIFGRPRTLAWPVDVYRVTIPAPSGRSDGLNPFERVVLGVLQAEPGMATEAVADTTCIPADLVRSVLFRLRDKGLLDGDNRPSREEHRSGAVREDEPRYVTAMVFQEAVGGRLLPYVHLLDERSTLTQQERDAREIRVIRVDGVPRRLPQPDSKSVLAALREAQNRSASRGKSLRVPLTAQIRVSPEPERHLLECPIAIQRSDAEYRIADPFGNGYSLALEDAFARLLDSDERLQEWMMQWRSSLASTDRGTDPDSATREPYEDASIRQLYPRLVESLVPGRSLGVRSTEKIYASLEWALFYCVDGRSAQVAVEVLRQTPAADWPGTLAITAEKVGLASPKYGFRAVPLGRLKDFLEGKAEMATVSAIALLQAANDVTHPLRSVAEVHPDFLLQVQEIKEIRDARSHGDAAAAATGESRFDPFLRGCVSLLLPKVRFSDSPKPRSVSSLDDSRLEARTALIGALGYKFVNQLGTSARDALLDAEQHWQSHVDDDDALPMINSLNASLQALVRVQLASTRGSGIPESEYLAAAAAKSQAAGLGDLPSALATVRSERIREAMQGNGSTLGACVVGYLLTTSPEQLESLAARQATLIQDIGDVLARRGHGNHAVPMTKSEAGRLRKATLNSIRTLLEA